jgi:hypothetical protein
MLPAEWLVRLPGEILYVFTELVWFITITVHAVFAVGVWADASSLKRQRAGPILAGPFWWMLATLVGGVVVAGVYWVMHHSILGTTRRDEEEVGLQADSRSKSEQAEAG